MCFHVVSFPGFPSGLSPWHQRCEQRRRNKMGHLSFRAVILNSCQSNMRRHQKVFHKGSTCASSCSFLSSLLHMHSAEVDFCTTGRTTEERGDVEAWMREVRRVEQCGERLQRNRAGKWAKMAHSHICSIWTSAGVKRKVSVQLLLSWMAQRQYSKIIWCHKCLKVRFWAKVLILKLEELLLKSTLKDYRLHESKIWRNKIKTSAQDCWTIMTLKQTRNGLVEL